MIASLTSHANPPAAASTAPVVLSLVEVEFMAAKLRTAPGRVVCLASDPASAFRLTPACPGCSSVGRVIDRLRRFGTDGLLALALAVLVLGETIGSDVDV